MDVTFSGHGGGLTLSVAGYERPDEKSGPDANWLNGEATLEMGGIGSFRASLPVSLRTDELEDFRDQLGRLVTELTGSAALAHLEDEVGLKMTLSHGRGTMSGFVQRHGLARLSFEELETDQSFLSQSYRQLDAIVRAFPVRGDAY